MFFHLKIKYKFDPLGGFVGKGKKKSRPIVRNAIP